jgi:hypothetical protein
MSQAHSPQYVKPFVKTNQPDAADAAAIVEPTFAENNLQTVSTAHITCPKSVQENGRFFVPVRVAELAPQATWCR